MTGYVCTVAGGKGGVGKTTTATNVGAALASEGNDVVVVDADLAMANLAGKLGLDVDRSVHDVLAGEAATSDAVTDTEWGMSIVPGERRLEAFAEVDPAKLRTVVEALEETHDAVILDTEPGLSHGSAVLMGLADGVVLTTTPDDVAVADTDKTGRFVERVDGEVIGVLVTRATAGTDVDGIDARLDYPVLGVIPDDPDATATEPLVLGAPDSGAALAYERVTEQLHRISSDGSSGEVRRVYDPAWFEDDREATDEEGEDGGYVGGIFG